MTESERPLTLDVARHTRYWLRHLKTFLPTAYTSLDSNRMFLAWMTVTALDILGFLHSSEPPATGTNPSNPGGSSVKPNERSDAIEWIYHCQHPGGGFKGSPGTDIGRNRRTASNTHWDPANAAGTLFALLALLSLRDDLSRVDRQACRQWLSSLQAEDGSFSEILGPDGKPAGTRDPRQMFLAIGSLYILGPEKGGTTEFDCIDVEAAKGWIYASQSFDGGMGQGPGTEAHGGYAYCSVASLILLGDIDLQEKSNISASTAKFLDGLTRWLVARQTAYEDLSEDDEDDEGAEETSVGDPASTAASTAIGAGSLQHNNETSEHWVGFAGRCNKAADTCYSFWVGDTIIVCQHHHPAFPTPQRANSWPRIREHGTLNSTPKLLGLTDLIDTNEHRRFLLDKTEHRFGGFGKVPGDLPDVLHSFFGLAALALMGQEGLTPTDPLFGITSEARLHLEALRREQGR